MTLKKILIRKFAVVLFLSLLGSIWAVGYFSSHSRLPTDRPVVHPTYATVESLIAEHDCWSGPAPADMEGKVPGHVVMWRKGGTGPEYLGQKWVDIALNHIFTTPDERVVTVGGFCR